MRRRRRPAAIARSIRGVETTGASRRRASHSVPERSPILAKSAARTASAIATAASRTPSRFPATAASPSSRALKDLPVVHSGGMGNAGVEQRHVPVPHFRVGRKSFSRRPPRAERDDVDPSLERRVVVLHAGRLAEHAGLDVAHEIHPVDAGEVSRADALERAHHRDRQGRGAAETGPEGNPGPELDLQRLADLQGLQERSDEGRPRLREELGGGSPPASRSPGRGRRPEDPSLARRTRQPAYRSMATLTVTSRDAST